MQEPEASSQADPLPAAEREAGDPSGDSRTIEDRTDGFTMRLKANGEWLKRFMQRKPEPR